MQENLSRRIGRSVGVFLLLSALGVVFSGVQLDLAVDLSDRADVFSLSSVFRLP